MKAQTHTHIETDERIYTQKCTTDDAHTQLVAPLTPRSGASEGFKRSGVLQAALHLDLRSVDFADLQGLLSARSLARPANCTMISQSNAHTTQRTLTHTHTRSTPIQTHSASSADRALCSGRERQASKSGSVQHPRAQRRARTPPCQTAHTKVRSVEVALVCVCVCVLKESGYIAYVCLRVSCMCVFVYTTHR